MPFGPPKSGFAKNFSMGWLAAGGLLNVRLSVLTVEFRIVVETRRNRSRIVRNGFWVPCRIFLAWFGPALGSNPVRNRRFPAGSLKVFGAMLAQPSGSNPQPFWLLCGPQSRGGLSLATRAGDVELAKPQSVPTGTCQRVPGVVGH